MLSQALESCDLFQKPTETLGYPDTQASCALPQPEVVNGTDPPSSKNQGGNWVGYKTNSQSKEHKEAK